MPPPSQRVLFEGGVINNDYCISTVCTSQGNRPTQEDFSVFENEKGFFAVCDGHGGNFVANFVAQKLHTFAETTLDTLPYSEIEATLREKLQSINVNLKSTPWFKHFFTGSTMVASVVRNEGIILANIGDSRAIVVNKAGEIIAATTDHKPNMPGEKERIEATGASVYEYVYADCSIFRIKPPRGDPGLAMSRAFGDFHLERFGCIADPDIISIPVTEEVTPSWILLASDGLWDVMDNEEVAAWFQEEFSKKTDTVTKKTVKEIMGKFVINVRDRWKCKFPTDAMDNTTIIFVKFKPDFFT